MRCRLLAHRTASADLLTTSFHAGPRRGAAGRHPDLRGFRAAALCHLTCAEPLDSNLLQGRGEVPPGATLSLDVELLSVKQDSRGYQVKLVEG